MGLHIDWSDTALPPRLRVGSEMPIAAFLAGKSAEEAAELLPRIFNVCAVTQRVAARLALDLTPLPGDDHALRDEILREHMLLFAVRLPGLLATVPQPGLLQQEGERLRRALFGPAPFPERLPRFLESLAQVEAPGLQVLNRIEQSFAPGEAVSSQMAPARVCDPFDGSACENSVAGRRSDHALLLDIAETYGRGPLWRATARALETEALAQGWQPRARLRADGTAEVSAARGTYFCRAYCDAEQIVQRFDRATPTDHGCAPRGAIHQSLATLTNPTKARVDLLMAILDPCTPVLHSPEPAHA